MSDPGVAVVIEDDADVRNLVDAVLTQSGFTVHSAGSGREGVELVDRHDATIVTLDVGLPDIDGYEVLRRIRQTSNCYVLMLTARTDELDTLTALQSGADDFIAKPFRPRELRARIAAMLRRPRDLKGVTPRESALPTPDDSEPGVLQHNGLVLNYETRTATLMGNKLSFTRSEFDLMHDLLRSAGSVRTKANLVRVVRGHHYRDDVFISDADERAVEVHMGNLRRKLGEDSREPKWLLTVRGVGYRLAPKRD